MKKKLFFALFLALLISCVSLGQVLPPPVPPPPPPGLPINGGVVFLLLTGLLYGVRKIKK